MIVLQLRCNFFTAFLVQVTKTEFYFINISPIRSLRSVHLFPLFLIIFCGVILVCYWCKHIPSRYLISFKILFAHFWFHEDFNLQVFKSARKQKDHLRRKWSQLELYFDFMTVHFLTLAIPSQQIR